MRSGLSVKDLAERVSAASVDVERGRLIEQLRYWTRLDLLTPNGPKHGGSGRWRTYPGSAIYVAAVLQELSRYRVAVPVMEAVATTIRLGLEGGSTSSGGEALADDPTTVEQQVAGPGGRPPAFYAARLLEALEGRRDIFLTLFAEGPDGETGIDLGYQPIDSEGPGFAARSAILLNLTKVFSGLR